MAAPNCPALEVDLAPANPGPFTVAHTLGHTPCVVLIQMTSDGEIWFQPARYDATTIYLEASDGGITGKAFIWG